MRVIGCGLPRTGTTSLKAALEKTLGGKCYHMWEVFENKGQNDHEFWIRKYHGKVSDEETRDFFIKRGYTAAIDLPSCFHYKYVQN